MASLATHFALLSYDVNCIRSITITCIIHFEQYEISAQSTVLRIKLDSQSLTCFHTLIRGQTFKKQSYFALRGVDVLAYFVGIPLSFDCM